MLWGAATVKVILGGLSGTELRDLSELVGEYDKHQTSYQHADDGAVTVTTSTQGRKVLTPGQIRTLDASKREALVIHATTPAVRVRMRRHYEGPDTHLYARAEHDAHALLNDTDQTDTPWRAAA